MFSLGTKTEGNSQNDKKKVDKEQKGLEETLGTDAKRDIKRERENYAVNLRK